MAGAGSECLVQVLPALLDTPFLIYTRFDSLSTHSKDPGRIHPAMGTAHRQADTKAGTQDLARLHPVQESRVCIVVHQGDPDPLDTHGSDLEIKSQEFERSGCRGLTAISRWKTGPQVTSQTSPLDLDVDTALGKTEPVSSLRRDTRQLCIMIGVASGWLVELGSCTRRLCRFSII